MNKFNRIISGIQALAALILLGAVTIWAPPCDKLLELTSGKMIPMKCHYTGRAAIALAVIILATAAVSFLAKNEQKKFMIVTAVEAILLFLLFSSLIGVCVQPMQCHSTAFWGKGTAIVVLLASVVGLLAGKEGQLPD